MKKLFFLLCFTIGILFAQVNQFDSRNFVDQPAFAIKIAPRIFSPRIAFEKVTEGNSTYGFEARLYTWWLPQAARVEGFYRYYFSGKAPIGGYIQAKLAVGYMDYKIANLNTTGMHLGAGFAAGKQFHVGTKRALIDLFGGIQVLPPIYFTKDYIVNNTFINDMDYKVMHYLLLATPIEFGVRFGFFGTKKVYVPFDVETTY
jgi:hypothetical protein